MTLSIIPPFSSATHSRHWTSLCTKRQLSEIRKQIWPVIILINGLTSFRYAYIKSNLKAYPYLFQTYKCYNSFIIIIIIPSLKSARLAVFSLFNLKHVPYPVFLTFNKLPIIDLISCDLQPEVSNNLGATTVFAQVLKNSQQKG